MNKDMAEGSCTCFQDKVLHRSLADPIHCIIKRKQEKWPEKGQKYSLCNYLIFSDTEIRKCDQNFHQMCTLSVQLGDLAHLFACLNPLLFPCHFLSLTGKVYARSAFYNLSSVAFSTSEAFRITPSYLPWQKCQ